MKKLTKKLIVVTLAFLLIYLITVSKNNFIIDVSDTEFSEVKTCPACYGITLCTHYQFQQLKLTGWTRYKPFQFLNGKNVFYGELGYEQVVVKKLAHNDELRKVDQLLCKNAELTSCNTTEAIMLISERFKRADVKSLLGDTQRLFGTDLFRCPSLRLINLMNKRCITDIGTMSRDLSTSYAKQAIIYTAMTNPEPLLLQMFPATEGWPFPRLLGACGRTIVVENGGRMLSEYEDASWKKRVEIAAQLLKLAQQLTENALDYALYMTDVNMHNFAVDKDGVLRLIDVENIIVVDKSKVRKDKPLGWDEPYINYGIGCHNCLSFSIHDLCTHEISDHNYYAVCRGILAPRSYYCRQGFLHDIPQNREGMLLHDLLDKCANPTSDLERLEIVPKLIETLEELVY